MKTAGALLSLWCLASLNAACEDPTGHGEAVNPGSPILHGEAPPAVDDEPQSVDDAPPIVDEEPPVQPVVVELELLTYNVAGLPLGLSNGQPAEASGLIGPLLNDFDLVLVQEDFGYHDELASGCTLPHQSEPMETSLTQSLGDGLNQFSRSSFTGLQRVRWERCHGWLGAKSDCLTPKGFTMARHVVEGFEIDIYNSHFDAGRDDGDIDARAAQVAQLVAFMNEHSHGRAILLAGDTNMKEEDEAVLSTLLEQAGLTDVCRALACPEPLRIDRVMVRSSDAVHIEARLWEVDGRFVDTAGEPLSDHEAVRAVLALGAGSAR